MPATKPFIVRCPCGQKNRATDTNARVRCGKCRREFRKDELIRACMLGGFNIDTFFKK